MNTTRIIFAVVSLLMSVVVIGQTPASEPNKGTSNQNITGTISGKVLSDDGQPVSGAQVWVAQISNSPVRQTAVTDAEGRFNFSGLPTGQYTLSAAATAMVFERPADAASYKIGDTATITLMKGGVITGRVTNAAGELLTGYFVQVTRVRDAEGRKVNEANMSRPALTDDRGIYRLYGLRPGIYIVSVTRKGPVFPRPTDNELETYYPSSTRETAQEVEVQTGAEISGIDIRHREEMGHSISGSIEGNFDVNTRSFISLRLKAITTDAVIANTQANIQAGDSRWIFNAVADGEYEIDATFVTFGNNRSEPQGYSEPKKIVVRGADVTGLTLKLTKLGKISGRVVIEPRSAEANTCESDKPRSSKEILLFYRPEKLNKSLQLNARQDTAPDEQGNFDFSGIMAGTYHLTARLPDPQWFLKGMSLPQTGNKNSRREISSTGLTISTGQEISDVQVLVGTGAAQLRGTIKGEEGKPLPAPVLVHLIPSEANAASQLLRYYMIYTRNGSFEFRNLAPGKYWLLSQTISPSDNPLQNSLAGDVAARANLRKLAEAANNVVELKPCQVINDFVLQWPVK